MKPLDLKLDDEPYEIKMEDIKVDEVEEKVELKKKFDLNFKEWKDMSKQIKIAMAGMLVTFLGSFFNFWGLKVDGLGKLNYGNLFNGFHTGGVLGIIFILAIIAACVLLYLNMQKFAIIAELVALAAFLIQVIVIIIWGKASLGGSQPSSLYFGIGFYICLLGMATTAYFTYNSFKKNNITKVL